MKLRFNASATEAGQSVDNESVRRSQLERLERLRAERDGEEVGRALAELSACAESGSGNLLELSVSAARVGATVGEMSLALERVFGRHEATSRTRSATASSASSAWPAGGPACWWPSWVRTATIADRR